MRKIFLAAALSASLVSVTACDSSTLGTLGGAGAGGLLGSQIGGGKGRLAATAAGTLLGAFLGNRAVAALSDKDTDYAAQAEQRAYGAPVGQQIQWENPDSGNYGTITPIREGRNAQTGQYGDMVEMGVLDPTKVARCALQNAASVAGLILTTDAMVAELPKEESHAGHGHGGGMGGMGGMDF